MNTPIRKVLFAISWLGGLDPFYERLRDAADAKGIENIEDDFIIEFSEAVLDDSEDVIRQVA